MAACRGRHANVGITPYAQEQLGDLVFVELPAPGRGFEQGSWVAVVESAAPTGRLRLISGEITDVIRASWTNQAW